MQIYAEKIRDTRTLLKYAKKCGNKRSRTSSLSGIWGGAPPQTHLLAILSLENTFGGNKTALSVHLLGQSFTRRH